MKIDQGTSTEASPENLSGDALKQRIADFGTVQENTASVTKDIAGNIDAVRTSLSKPMTNVESTRQSFADSLKPTNFDVGNVIIWQLENDPSVLVRENQIGGEETLNTLEISLREGEALFANMRDAYGIKVVSMKSKRERNKEGKEAIFTFVDRINGQNLSKIEILPVEAKDELEALYLSLGQHYDDAWKQGLKYWGDCRNDQFVYGNKYEEKDKHFFVVDVDSKFYREGDNKFDTIEAALGGLCGDLLESERKFDPPVRFQAARDKLSTLIDEMIAQKGIPEIKQDSRHLIEEARVWLSQPTNKKAKEKAVPQPGESTGNAPLITGINKIVIDGRELQIDCKLSGSESLSIEEILTSRKIDQTSIPYYEDVYQDVTKSDERWGVTKKVKEYADYLNRYPETVATLPPIQCLNNKLHDGAHRISAIYLLSKLYPNSHWTNVKLKVDFYESELKRSQLPLRNHDGNMKS